MGYCIQEIVSWYQRKIGTYDKQEWEKTVEQRILSGFTHVPKKTAKLETDLIDVDLVRGSSFTKAKPKHGFLTVTKLGVARLVFLPIYARWWSHQTSPKLFCFLLLLYMLQLLNLSIFSYASISLSEETIERVSATEVVVPAAMMIFLCVLHSQIVSPHFSSSKDLAPFNSKSRRLKRTKRRPRLSQDLKCTPDTSSDLNYHNGSDTSSKFSKRIRPRKLSFEDGSKTGLRRRRGVVWDTTPRLSISPDVDNVEDSYGSNPYETKSRDSRKCSQEDDGFESLNSQQLGDGSDSTPVDGVDPCDNDVIVGVSEDINEVKDATETAERQMNKDVISPNPAAVTAPEAVFRNNWLQQSTRRASIGLCRVSSGDTDHKDSDTDCTSNVTQSSYNSSDEGATGSFCPALTEGTTSAAEWIGITTNSEDCSVSSDIDGSISHFELNEHPFASEFNMSPSAILSPSCAASDKVSCTMWENRDVKKAELSVLDISSAIIARVEAMPENMDYFYGGMLVSILLGLVPSFCRLMMSSHSQIMEPLQALNDPSSFINTIIYSLFGSSVWERVITIIALFERVSLACMFFFLVAVAERTFKQRFLYAKFFSHLTSFRRARKSELPHFRLNKVRNIKTWLSVRSYLRKRGPQHSVDAIVSSLFLITLLLLSFLSVQLLKDSDRMHSQYNIEALAWCIVLGFFLLRFMTLGTKINQKYRNLSVLITEQINLYLQIEQKPNKKEELMVSNSVLKLAADLLKELECPYKISGVNANPYLYTITKVVILSALSGVLSEMLGFKLKLHKIKIK